MTMSIPEEIAPAEGDGAARVPLSETITAVLDVDEAELPRPSRAGPARRRAARGVCLGLAKRERRNQ